MLLNDPQYVEAAAGRWPSAFRDGGTSLENRMTFAFRTLTARRPGPRELVTLEALYREQAEEISSGRSDAGKLLGIGQAPQASIDPVECAAMTVVVQALLSYDQTVAGHSTKYCEQNSNSKAHAMDHFDLNDFRKQLDRIAEMGPVRPDKQDSRYGPDGKGRSRANRSGRGSQADSGHNRQHDPGRASRPRTDRFSRLRRIAAGSGVDPRDVSVTVQQFDLMAAEVTRLTRMSMMDKVRIMLFGSPRVRTSAVIKAFSGPVRRPRRAGDARGAGSSPIALDRFPPRCQAVLHPL